MGSGRRQAGSLGAGLIRWALDCDVEDVRRVSKREEEEERWRLNRDVRYSGEMKVVDLVGEGEGEAVGVSGPLRSMTDSPPEKRRRLEEVVERGVSGEKDDDDEPTRRMGLKGVGSSKAGSSEEPLVPSASSGAKENVAFPALVVVILTDGSANESTSFPPLQPSPRLLLMSDTDMDANTGFAFLRVRGLRTSRSCDTLPMISEPSSVSSNDSDERWERWADR